MLQIKNIQKQKIIFGHHDIFGLNTEGNAWAFDNRQRALTNTNFFGPTIFLDQNFFVDQTNFADPKFLLAHNFFGPNICFRIGDFYWRRGINPFQAEHFRLKSFFI